MKLQIQSQGNENVHSDSTAVALESLSLTSVWGIIPLFASLTGPLYLLKRWASLQGLPVKHGFRWELYDSKATDVSLQRVKCADRSTDMKAHQTNSMQWLHGLSEIIKKTERGMQGEITAWGMITHLLIYIKYAGCGFARRPHSRQESMEGDQEQTSLALSYIP